MRGYFGIGVEGISKPMNVGNLMRSAHAFGAGFFFTIAAAYQPKGVRSDTAQTPDHVPFYRFDTAADLTLPEGCTLVGVELMEDAVDLPVFPHPLTAAYVLGRERGSLTPELVARCDRIVRIPTKFAINVGVAGAIVMYDRVLSLGRYGDRPLNPRAKPEPRSAHVYGEPINRNREQP